MSSRATGEGDGVKSALAQRSAEQETVATMLGVAVVAAEEAAAAEEVVAAAIGAPGGRPPW